MLPMNPANNLTYLGLANSESASQFVLARASIGINTSYLIHNLGRKLVVPMPLHAWRLKFFGGIRIVLRLCSKPKMIWVNTGRVVFGRTIMKDAKTIRDCAAVYYPRGNVRPYQSEFSSAPSDLAVSRPETISGPQPARICFYNLLPKSVQECCGHVLCGKFWIRMKRNVFPSVNMLASSVTDSMIVHSRLLAAHGLLALRGLFIMTKNPQPAT